MAALTGSVPTLGGYDYEFTSEVPADWECLVCHLTLKDPVQIGGCGHRLCEICIGTVLRLPSPSCPADRKPISRDKIFQDVACHRKILDLTVKCPCFGCSWTGELRSVESHQNGCSFQVISCPNRGCSEKLIKRDMTIHASFDCSWRVVSCEYCKQSFIKNQKKIHLATCPKFPVLCPNRCSIRDISRDKVDAHVRNECLETEVHCDYKKLGCSAVFPRSKAKHHSENQVERHLALALRGLEATQHEVRALVSLVKDQSEQIKRLEQELGKCKLQTKSCSPYLWKISNFDSVLSKAVSGEQEVIFSESFFSSSNGYKLRIKMYPNGGALSQDMHKRVKGKFLSLYIVVVPGEYDSVLPWPFKDCVKLSLIDQNPSLEGRKNVTYTLNFAKFNAKPDAEESVGWGFADTISHDVLHSRSYIKNDALYVMATVIQNKT